MSLENDASANQGQRAGNYKIQAEKFNDRNVWKRDDGKFVVWFNSETAYWTIGSSVGSGGGIYAPSEFKCPNEAGSQWTYYEVGSSNTFLDAGDDISVKCQGKEKLEKSDGLSTLNLYTFLIELLVGLNYMIFCLQHQTN